MDQKIKALLVVALAYILIFVIKLITSLQIFSFLSVISILSSYGNIVIFYLAAATFILVLMAVTGKDFARYGISLRNASNDLKVIPLMVLPLFLYA